MLYVINVICYLSLVALVSTPEGCRQRLLSYFSRQYLCSSKKICYLCILKLPILNKGMADVKKTDVPKMSSFPEKVDEDGLKIYGETSNHQLKI